MDAFVDAEERAVDSLEVGAEVDEVRMRERKNGKGEVCDGGLWWCWEDGPEVDGMVDDETVFVYLVSDLACRLESVVCS